MSNLCRVTSLFLAAGCAVAPIHRKPVAQQATDLVVIEKDPSGTAWQATWQLVEPARELRFERPAAAFRARTFEILTPGFRMEQKGEFEVLRTMGQAVREVRIRFPEFDEQLIREYEFFRRFSDGGIAIYTGHLVARPVSDHGDHPFVRRFRLVPPQGQAVILGGERREGAVEWTDAHGRGTYAYIGSATPIVSDDVISVLDPGLPAWLDRRTADALPRVFAIYRDRLEAKPATRPVVLFDYKRSTGTGYSNSGGTLPGLIQLGVEGSAWETESRQAMLQLLHFLAHEAAHVWNGEIAHYPGTEDAWMHEGSADALAERVLLELGVIDEAAFLGYQTNALNDCRAGLAVTALRPSVRQGRPRLAYVCGNMISLLTESVLVPAQADLFNFWRALIARARSQGGAYTAEDYVAVWRALGANDADVAIIESFLDGTMDSDRLVSELRSRGVAIDRDDPPPSYRQSLAREAVASLMATDCGGRVGFRSSPTAFVLDDDVSCDALVPGARIVGFGAHDVLREGHLAYDHVHEMCGASRTVSVTLVADTGVTQEVSVECHAALPSRPTYVRIASRPRRGAHQRM